MVEHRSSQRQKTFKGGSISFGAAPNIDCLVRNLSATGACIEVNSSVGIPDAFNLFIKPERIRRVCKVVWREGGKIGVEFARAVHSDIPHSDNTVP